MDYVLLLLYVHYYACRTLTRRKHQFPRKHWDMRKEQKLKVSKRVQMIVNLLLESSKTALTLERVSTQAMSNGRRTVLQKTKRLQSW